MRTEASRWVTYIKHSYLEVILMAKHAEHMDGASGHTHDLPVVQNQQDQKKKKKSCVLRNYQRLGCKYTVGIMLSKYLSKSK